MKRKGLMRPDHWVMSTSENVQPAPAATIDQAAVRRAAQFAIRVCTRNGTELDFDPDALVIEMQNALFGCGEPRLGRIA